MSIVKFVVAVLMASGLVDGVAAQAHGDFAWRELPGAAQLAIGFAWEPSSSANRPGVARLLAECRLVRARAAAPSVRNCVVHVDADRSCVVGVVEAADVAGASFFLAALLDDTAPLSDDTIATLAARVALAADDAATLYPGDVLAARAASAFGIATQTEVERLGLLDIPPASVRELLLAPINLHGVGVGSVSESMRQMARGLAWPPPSPEWSGAGVAAEGPRTEGLGSELHARSDAPWVMAAFAAPLAVPKPALAVALEVARARAVRAMRSRGAEAGARAPFVAWSWLDGDRLVRFHRRAMDPMQRLPGEREQGDAAFAAATARAELERLLTDLRTNAPSAAECDAARERLLAEHGLELRSRHPVAELLPGIAVVELLRSHRGIDRAALASVTPAEAHAALVAVLVADRACWHELLPLPRMGHHWPRR